MRVRGYAARSADAPLAPFEFERRAPGARDVHLAIEYCGICHSDIHFARNEWGTAIYPCVPGHEIVGRVLATGEDVTRFAPGDRVGVGCFIGSCRTCGHCVRGLENYCENGPTMTYGSIESDGRTQTLGGYSAQIVVDEDFVFRMPGVLDAAAAAPLLCAGITTYSPLTHVGVSTGDHVAVMGLGGLGHMAVQLASSFGADVTVLSHTPSKRGDALQLGAGDFIDVTARTALERHAGRFDYVIDTVSARHDINAPLATLRAGGTMIVVGAPAEPLSLQTFPLILGRRTVMGSLVGGVAETQAMLDHCGAHRITSWIETIAPDQINEAWARTVAGDVRYRFVIDCAAFENRKRR